MRLIDADALKEYFSYSARLCEDIDKFPTIEERKTGKWLFPYGGKRYKKCSACGQMFYSIPSTSNYCPNCGADMRGEQDD